MGVRPPREYRYRVRVSHCPDQTLNVVIWPLNHLYKETASPRNRFDSLAPLPIQVGNLAGRSTYPEDSRRPALSRWHPCASRWLGAEVELLRNRIQSIHLPGPAKLKDAVVDHDAPEFPRALADPKGRNH